MKAAITTLALLVALTDIKSTGTGTGTEPELYKDPLKNQNCIRTHSSPFIFRPHCQDWDNFIRATRNEHWVLARWSSRMQPAERCCTSWSGRLTGYRTRLSSGREQMS